jgi:hypothetical protein
VGDEVIKLGARMYRAMQEAQDEMDEEGESRSVGDSEKDDDDKEEQEEEAEILENRRTLHSCLSKESIYIQSGEKPQTTILPNRHPRNRNVHIPGETCNCWVRSPYRKFRQFLSGSSFLGSFQVLSNCVNSPVRPCQNK